jgi:hypothetical protein
MWLRCPSVCVLFVRAAMSSVNLLLLPDDKVLPINAPGTIEARLPTDHLVRTVSSPYLHRSRVLKLQAGL